MNLIEISLRRPVFAWVLMFSLITFGAIGLNRMGISQMPDVDFPILSISLSYEGAAPQVVESDLIDPIEQRLLTIEGIKEMRSSALQGRASFTLEFGLDRNIDVALQEVQSALSQLRLPQGVDPPVIRKQNPEEDPIIFMSVYGGKDRRELLNWTDTFLLDQLRFLPGVGEVSIGGFASRNLRIWFDSAKLNVYDLTISDVMEALKTQHIETAAGQFTEGDRELRVRWIGEAIEVSEVEDIKILKRGGQNIYNSSIRIKDVARVEDGLSDIRRLARFRGQEAAAVQVRKQRGTNEVEVAKSVRKRLEELKPQFPPGYGYRINVDFTRSTESTVHLTVEKLWVAGVITILVCFLFLGSFHSAINILFSIPTSIVGSFMILSFSGFTLNLFTLLALTLSISIVVDDAIMLLENIVRHYRMGKGSYRAALEGAMEVLPAAIAATLAVLAIFVPVIFMDGVIGKFFFQFGVTISAAVLLSLLEAITITPMRAAALLSSEPKPGRFEIYLEHLFEKFAQVYAKALAWSLRWRWLVLIASTGLFAASLMAFKLLRAEFVPSQDQDILIVTGQTPPGSSLELTNLAAQKIEAILAQDQDIQGFMVSVGAGGPNASVNQVFVPLSLKPRSERKAGHVEIQERLRAKFKEVKGIRMSIRDISARNLAAGRINPIAISLRGPELDVLNEKSRELIARLESEKLGADLDTDFRVGIPELVVIPRREAMAYRGVAVEVVGRALSAAVGGLAQGQYTAEGRRFDIRFKLPESQIRNASDIKKIRVRNNAGNVIPLSELVDIKEGKAIQSINRVNRQRAISVFGNLAAGQSQAVVLDRAQAIAREILPNGYTFALEGAAAGFTSSFKSLSGALWIGLLVAYLILAVQFNSFVHPISVLMALPFSVSGAALALLAFQQSLNLFSFIGLIVLMGIAKKNSILLVEFTNQVRERRKDLSVREALIQGCPVRLRPILMTSVATVAAATPLVLGGGLGSETRIPMGLAIIGGTVVSTALTLFVVPALYEVLARFEHKKREYLKA